MTVYIEPPTIAELETLAVKLLAHEWSYWRQNNLPPILFDEEVAMEVLIKHGIRPSGLGVDLERLIYMGNRMEALDRCLS
jgi:hypothetical protein